MANKAEKKPVWQYAKEARERKKEEAHGSKKINHNNPIEIEISTPATDFNSPVIQKNFLTRAGLKSYADELNERIKDLTETPNNTYFSLEIKLPKRVYEILLEQASAMIDVSPDWNERDQIEALILFSNAEVLTKVKTKA